MKTNSAGEWRCPLPGTLYQWAPLVMPCGKYSVGYISLQGLPWYIFAFSYKTRCNMWRWVCTPHSHGHSCSTLSHTFMVTKHRCVSITAALTAPTPNPSPDIPALLPAHEQHFPPPSEVPAQSSPPCQQTEHAGHHSWNGSLLQDLPAVPATPGAHPQHLHPPLPAAQEAPWKLKRSFPESPQQDVPIFPLELYLGVGKCQLLEHSIIWGFTVYGYSLFIVIEGVINHQGTCRQSKLWLVFVCFPSDPSA